ncbi:uncharacterized protein LOC121640804 [Melanotaenia boesemani]|uniref:uncharacterized protein LOC121640804 n=1 Tax=Melanotaenia boesemani TaxID=1250792 RepID=UPI001C05306E|nr:uncharacterized protein LOC121640804 [Melanotaenia boesemani]
MLGHRDIYSRLFVLICAAVMSFIMRSHAARASPMITGHHGENSNILRMLNTPHSQHHPLSAGLLSKDDRTETNFRDTLSVINHQPRPVNHIKGSFSYSQHNGDNSVQRGEVRPASSTFTGHSLHRGQNFGRWQSRNNDYTVPQKESTGTSYYSRSVIIRKSHNEEEARTSDSLKTDKDKSLEKLLYPPAFPSQTSRHLMSREHYKDHEETNVLPLVRTQSASNEIQPSKVLSFTRQTDPHAAVLGNSWDATDLKKNPSPEQLIPYLTNNSKKLNSVSSRVTQRHKKLQSYLFKNSVGQLKGSTADGRAASREMSNIGTFAHKQSLSGAQSHSKSFPSFRPFSRIDPIKQDSVAQSVGQKESFTTHRTLHPTFHISEQSPSQKFWHPSSVEDKHLERFGPSANGHLWDNYSSRSGKVSLVGRVNATTKDVVRYYKPGSATKGIFHLRELIKPLLQPAEPSGPPTTETTNSQQSNLNKRMDYRFKIANAYPYMSQKYKFGQREASATTTVPAKLERMDNSSPSSGALHVTQPPAVSTPKPFTTASKHIQHLLPENDASMSRNTNQSRFRLYKGIFSLEGFGKQPLEGAKTLADGPNMTVVPKPGFEGLKLTRLQTWQPKRIRIHKWYNQTGEGMQSSKSTSTVSQNELSSDGFKPLLEIERSNGSTTDEKHSKVRLSQGIRTTMNRTNAQNRTQWRFTNQNPATASHVVSSGYMRSAGRHKFVPSLISRPRAAKKNKFVPEGGILRNASTSSTVRGKRVKQKSNSKKLNGFSSLTNAAIVRLPKHPARVSPITYADILGSASFSSVKAASQTPTTLTDRDYFPNMTTAEGKGGQMFRTDDGRNMSGSPEASPDSEKKDLKSVEEMDNDEQMADLFLDHEGSGVGGFNRLDVLSTVTESQEPGKDSLEMDYLRIATGNISFKSAKQSDQQ